MENNFKVGDKVIILDDCCNTTGVHTKGFTGTVIQEGILLVQFRKHQEGMLTVDGHKNCQYYSAHHLKLK